MKASTSQAEIEARTFIFNFFNSLDRGLAEEYKDEVFGHPQARKNLELTLSTLPKDFFENLVVSKLPKTSFPSIIYNPIGFISEPNRFRQPLQRRRQLIYKRASELKITSRQVGHTRAIHIIWYDRAGKFFLTASEDSNMKLWHYPSLSLMFTFKGHQDLITYIDVTPNRQLIATISCDQTIRLWSVLDGSCIDLISDASLAPFNCVAFSPDGRYLVVGSERGRILIWKLYEIDTTVLLQKHPPLFRNIFMRSAVRSCCFSPGGNLVAAALDSGILGIVILNDEFQWTVKLAYHCDFCFFHPLAFNHVFVVSSKTCTASQYRISNTLVLVNEYNAKTVSKRASSCSFTLSTDATVLFGIAGNYVITWSTVTGVLIDKFETPHPALYITPHPMFTELVAVVMPSSILIYDFSKKSIQNTLNIPSDFPKITCATWDVEGLVLIAGDKAGGFYVFQRKTINPNNNVVQVSQHFFPSDFTPSIWADGIGQIEESTGIPVHFNPTSLLIDIDFNRTVSRYMPHTFDEIYCPYVEDPYIAINSEREKSWLLSNSSSAVERVDEAPIQSQPIRDLSLLKDPSQLIMGVGEEAEAVFSDTSDDNSFSSEDDGNLKPKTKYPFWTTVDTVNQNTYFPQVNDRIAYIREGHLDMINQEPSLSRNIRPNINEEVHWPKIGLFEIINVEYKRYQCEIKMRHLVSQQRGRNIYKDLEQFESLETDNDEPIREFSYAISNAPYFLVLCDHYKRAIDNFPSMQIGDDVVIFYRKKNNTEVPYPGRILSLVDKPTRYNSVGIDWGQEENDLVSPWEIFSFNKKEILPRPTMKYEIVDRVLSAALTSRDLRQYFKTSMFQENIVYPCDYGLIRRRIANGFYRSFDFLVHDINAVAETQDLLGNYDFQIIRVLNDRIMAAVNNPTEVESYLNFDGFKDNIIAEQEATRESLEKANRKEEKRVIRRYTYVEEDPADQSSDGEFQLGMLDEDEEIPAPPSRRREFDRTYNRKSDVSGFIVPDTIDEDDDFNPDYDEDDDNDDLDDDILDEEDEEVDIHRRSSSRKPKPNNRFNEDVYY